MAVNSPWWTARIIQRSKHLRCTTFIPVFQLKGKALTWEDHVRSSSNSALQDCPTQLKSISKPTTKAITISKAVQAFIQKVKADEDMMKAEVADYEIGKRHLANIMGEDPENFSQADINRAIEYLLPSGIFEKKARPVMKDPYEIFPQRKAAQFGIEGRPFHWLYFTTLPNYYALLYDVTCKMDALKAMEDKLRNEHKFEELEGKSLNGMGSEWISEHKFSAMLNEKLTDKEYKHFLVLMERLIAHPLSQMEADFIMKFRAVFQMQLSALKSSEIMYDETGRAYAVGKGTRKASEATVTVFRPGSGQISINGTDLSYFSNLLLRETILFPLIVTKLIGAVDFTAQVVYAGPSAQAGAIRVALSRAITAFVDDNIKEQMRLSGMLTIDPRKNERKKPGQHKARKKFTWKRR